MACSQYENASHCGKRHVEEHQRSIAGVAEEHIQNGEDVLAVLRARQGSVPGRVELQGGNENGTCQLVMARPMMIGYGGMSIPRWRILVSGSWHRWRGQASV